MIDTKKLQAFLRHPFLATELPPIPGLEDGDEEIIEQALKDEMSDESQTARKLSPAVGYMELGEEAGAFACANCRFITEGGFCGHAMVRAYVNAENGSCDRFWPSGGHVVFPPEPPVE